MLRLLFAKINNQAQQAYYANLPPHPLGGPGSENMPMGFPGAGATAGGMSPVVGGGAWGLAAAGGVGGGGEGES